MSRRVSRRWPRIAACSVAIIAGLLPAAWPAEAQAIYLNRCAVVEGARLSLGALATVVDSDPPPAGDPAGRIRLEELDLGPVPDRPTLLPLRSIRERLDAGGLGRANVVGGRVAVLPAPTVRPEARVFYRQLLFWLDEREADPLARLEVETLDGNEAAPPDASGGADFRFRASGEPAGGPAGRQREIQVCWSASPGQDPDGRQPGEGLRPKEGVLRLLLRRYLPIAVAAEELRPRMELAPGQVRMEEVDAGDGVRLPDGLLREVPRPGRYRVGSRVAAGSPIPLSALQKVLPVKGGDPVRIHFLGPGIRITMPGRAFGSADYRDPVEVSALATNRRFRAVVVGIQEVEVALP